MSFCVDLILHTKCYDIKCRVYSKIKLQLTLFVSGDVDPYFCDSAPSNLTINDSISWGFNESCQHWKLQKQSVDEVQPFC